MLNDFYVKIAPRPASSVDNELTINFDGINITYGFKSREMADLYHINAKSGLDTFTVRSHTRTRNGKTYNVRSHTRSVDRKGRDFLGMAVDQ